MFKNYNTLVKLILPLDLKINLKENGIAFSIHQLVESISNEAFASLIREKVTLAYLPRMMLKIILYSNTQSVFYRRKIEVYLSIENCTIGMQTFLDFKLLTSNIFCSTTDLF